MSSVVQLLSSPHCSRATKQPHALKVLGFTPMSSSGNLLSPPEAYIIRICEKDHVLYLQTGPLVKQMIENKQIRAGDYITILEVVPNESFNIVTKLKKVYDPSMLLPQSSMLHSPSSPRRGAAPSPSINSPSLRSSHVPSTASSFHSSSMGSSTHHSSLASSSSSHSFSQHISTHPPISPTKPMISKSRSQPQVSSSGVPSNTPFSPSHGTP
ncbi:hypothetical protein ADUPG1_001112, partial [Aduncisulcus paluster]